MIFLKTEVGKKSAKPYLIGGDEQRLSWSFEKCFHMIIIDQFSLRGIFQLTDFLMEALANLVFSAWWWKTFFAAAVAAICCLVLVCC